MIDKNKVYKTRDGREVRIYATDGANGKIHGGMLDKEGWEHRTWTGAGRIMLCEEHPYDLIEVRPRHKRTVWVNVYGDSKPALHLSRELADQYRCDRIACIKVELDFEEGEGL